MSGDVPMPEPRPRIDDHNATGLDLARQIAREVGAGGPRRVRRTPRVEPQVSGAYADGRDPQLVGETVDRLVATRGWKVRVGLETLLSRWPALVGPANAEHSRPETLNDGELAVQADSTAWASSLRAMAPQIVAKLNAQLGEGTIKRIRVRGPDAPSWKHGRRSVRGRGVRDTYG